MDELRALRYFSKVVETGSFTKAASLFSVPPSSLSRRVADLEKNLGATLLKRSTRVVKVTEIGQTYYEQVQQVLHQLEQSNEAVRSYQTKPMGTLRISCLVGFGNRILLPLLDEYGTQCCLISFNSEALSWCRSHSKLEIGWVLDDYDTRSQEVAERLQPEYLICDYRKIPANASLWNGTSQWMLYDVMDPETALDWAQRGATLIETADVGKLLQHPVLGQRACTHGL